MKKLKILIVEDDMPSRLLLKLFTQSFVREVIFANNGLEAVNMFKDHTDFDLVMMDIKMPVMNGLEAAKEIRKINTDVIIFAQSAYTMPEERFKAIDAGCNDFINKPITRGELNQMINKYFFYKSN